MAELPTPTQIIDQMIAKDAFSQWLGVEREEEGPGFCTLSMVVKPSMLNGFGIAHGGISFSLADSAFAFASNSRGQHAVSIETSIAHHQAVRAGDRLVASAKEVFLGNKIGTYLVEVHQQNNELVASFKGTVYRTSRAWETI